MVELTVGYVAGAIAAAIFIARLWSPTVLTFILSAILRDSNSAATWTAASAALQRSHWSWALGSDGSRNHGVRKDILLLTWIITIMSFLITLAGIITPLGLYDPLVTSDKMIVPFTYVRDTSSFALGTPPRSNLTFNRICSGRYQPVPCPFTDTISIEKTDSKWVNTTYPYGYHIGIPSILREVYSSGTDNSTTISNFFDIEWRRYQTKLPEDKDINNGTAYLVGSARVMESFALHDMVEPVEGLLIDSHSGGIGFRNHTVPLGFELGVSWTEDILFIEPETACVNTNLTIDYEINKIINSTTTYFTNVALTDRGGFASLIQEQPKLELKDSHIHPKLQERAYAAAWMANFYTAVSYNVTTIANTSTGTKDFEYLNSNIGKQFYLGSGEVGDYDALSLTKYWGSHLPISRNLTREKSENGLPLPSNPFGINTTMFLGVGDLCLGTKIIGRANITNILVNCGLMRGIPQRIDTDNSNMFDAGSKWSQPMYACASAVKATVKTVHFNFNGTKNINNLKVEKVQNKEYSGDQSKPLWGVENPSRRYYVDDIPLLWGLLDSKFETHPNISTVRSEVLYLPGYGNDIGATGLQPFMEENLPASNFYKNAMSGTYEIRVSTSGSRFGTTGDYSGSSNMAQWVKWQNLSSNAATMSMIPNLVFTDYAAAAVVGTKGIRGWRNSATENVIPVYVKASERQIRYRLAFAIPAFIVLLGLIIMTVLAVLAVILRRHNLQVLRLQLQSLSPGRIFTTFLHPELGGMTVPSREWSRTTGKTIINVKGDYPVSGSGIPSPQIVGGVPGEKGPHAFETSVSEGSTERDQFLGHSSSPPIPQPYHGAHQVSPVTPITPWY